MDFLNTFSNIVESFRNNKEGKTIVFDKTGTLTRSKPSVTDIVDLSGIGETELTDLLQLQHRDHNTFRSSSY